MQIFRHLDSGLSLSNLQNNNLHLVCQILWLIVNIWMPFLRGLQGNNLEAWCILIYNPLQKHCIFVLLSATCLWFHNLRPSAAFCWHMSCSLATSVLLCLFCHQYMLLFFFLLFFWKHLLFVAICLMHVCHLRDACCHVKHSLWLFESTGRVQNVSICAAAFSFLTYSSCDPFFQGFC